MLVSIFSSLQSFLFFNQKRSKFSLNACTHTHTHTHTQSHTSTCSLLLFIAVKQADTGTNTQTKVSLIVPPWQAFFHYVIWHVLQDVQVRKRLFVQQHRSQCSPTSNPCCSPQAATKVQSRQQRCEWNFQATAYLGEQCLLQSPVHYVGMLLIFSLRSSCVRVRLARYTTINRSCGGGKGKTVLVDIQWKKNIYMHTKNPLLNPQKVFC